MDNIIRVHGMENAYLVKGEHCYLVDTRAPMSRKKMYAALQENGVSPADLSHILITHCHSDHMGNLAGLKSKGASTVVAGDADVACIEGKVKQASPSSLNRLGRFLQKLPPKLIEAYQRCQPCEVDLSVKEGDRLEELGLEVIELPGHTRGGTGYVDRANRRAFIGDLVSYYFNRRLGLPTLLSSYSLAEIKASMEKLVDLDLDYMYPGHGGIIGPDASAQVAGLVKKKF